MLAPRFGFEHRGTQVELTGDERADGAKPLGILNAPELGERAPGKAGQLRWAAIRCSPLQNPLEGIDQLIRLRRCAKRLSGKR